MFAVIDLASIDVIVASLAVMASNVSSEFKIEDSVMN